MTTAITSRGCPHSCPFCLTYKKQYRIRDIEDILDEAEHCLSLGVGEIMYIDDLFTPNSQWVLRFCDGIEKRSLKFYWGYKTTIAGTTRRQIERSRQTGCYKICCGVETANQEGLEGYNKHCNLDEMAQFLEAIVTGGLSPVSGVDARAPVVMAMAARLSVQENRPVKLAEIEAQVVSG